MSRGVPFKRLVDPEEAIRIVYNEVGEGVNEKLLREGSSAVKLEDLPGRLSASDILSPISLPWFPKSLLDGCAVRSIDVASASEENPVELSYAGRVKIGQKPSRELGPRECIEVDTGSWLPVGADSVIPVEDLSFKNDRVIVERSVEPGSGVAMPATDVAKGDQLVEMGRPFGPETVAALASVGLDSAQATRKVRVTVFSTGVELVDPGSVDLVEDLPLTFDSNRVFLRSSIERWGLEVRDLGIVGDRVDDVIDAVSRAREENADVIMSTGGTSAGIDDSVFKAIESLGKLLVHGVRIRPGKPTLIGVLPGPVLFIGLPGNPRSVINVFDNIVAPLLSAVNLIPRAPGRKVKARTATLIPPARGREANIPLALIGSDPMSPSLAVPVARESYMIASYAKSDGYTVLGPGVNQPLKPGSFIEATSIRASRRSLLAFTDTPKIPEWARKYKVRAIYVPTWEPLTIIDMAPPGTLVVVGLDSNRGDPERIEAIDHYQRNVVMYSRGRECARTAVFSAYQEYATRVQGIEIPAQRAETARLLFEGGYVDCIIAPSDYEPANYENSEILGEEKVYLAVKKP
ncbi:MAG: molybdopterin molybdotransferase MoeA [Desulfurococcales archaeon]|nr:molybdopterin molybdotransferase MoeA [Desulfurococcales archaeon]